MTVTKSPSPRKAWIETALMTAISGFPRSTSPSPRKAWIETASTTAAPSIASGRLPPGRRGLKRSLG